jgi:hypothetical protein
MLPSQATHWLLHQMFEKKFTAARLRDNPRCL